MKNLVSVIITTKNRKELLTRAINSVLSQSYSDIELIVIDDGSTDGTIEYLVQNNIKFLKGEGKGGNHARNLGIKNAIGDYVAFLDDDDYWSPLKIELQMRLLQEKRCKLVYCGMILEVIKENETQFYLHEPRVDACGDMSSKILRSTCFNTSTFLCEKDLLFQVGLFDENLRFWQEYELSIRLAQYTEFYYLKQPLCVYRVDKMDKNRLTNKFYAWKDSVHYIYDKHKIIFAKLSIFDKFYKTQFYFNDALVRCKNSKLYGMALYYTIMSLPYNIAKLLLKKEKRVLLSDFADLYKI